MKSLLKIPFQILLLGIGLPVYSLQSAQEFQRAQNYLNDGGEVYFSFDLGPSNNISQFANSLSIDEFDGKTIHAYANKIEFNDFLKYDIYYEVQTHPGDLLVNPQMVQTPAEMKLEWNKYPTFEAYVAAMHEYETLYPDLVKIVKIGESNQGRDLLYAKISDKVNETEPEPRHMYTSAMHGDETAMYVNFVRLIDYLVTNYQTDAYVKKLVDNIEIWICPLENPDGLYRNDNSTITGARRGNANNIDLNRHYPRAGGPLTGNQGKEPEAQAVIDLIDSLEFVLSANAHGGAELLNYPFDYANVFHPDDDWMQAVYREWADAVHAIDRNVMSDQNNGITRGYSWYQIWGSRMDYVTYHKGMREVTFEASGDKLIGGSSYPFYWDTYHQALLRYIEHNLFGINGTVTDAITGQSIKARVRVDRHDDAQSFRFSKMPHGDYYRPISQGTYSVEYSAVGYHTHMEENVVVNFGEGTLRNIKLMPINIPVSQYLGLKANEIRINNLNNNNVSFDFYSSNANAHLGVYNYSGQLLKSFPLNSSGPQRVNWNGLDNNGNDVGNGIYFIRVLSQGKNLSKNFVISK